MDYNSGVKHREGRFAGWDGSSLYYQAWTPSQSRPRAVLVNLHGLGDHSGLYPNLASYIPARGVALYAYDMRGNGRSPGQRAYLRSWQEYREDLQAFVARVREWEGDLPLFLLGNSLGGLVVLDYALDHAAGLAGVIAAAVGVWERFPIVAILAAISRELASSASRRDLVDASRSVNRSMSARASAASRFPRAELPHLRHARAARPRHLVLQPRRVEPARGRGGYPVRDDKHAMLLCLFANK